MKRVPVLMLVAWAVFLPSWFLPVHGGGELTGYTVDPASGWEAFLTALVPLFGWDRWDSGLLNVFSICSALSNGLMLFSVDILLRRRATQRVPRWLAWGFVAATAVDLYWVRFWQVNNYYHTIGALLVGYWLWVASFGLSAAALFRLRQRVEASNH